MLTFIPFPLPEESPGSIIKRFAINNGCCSLSQIRSLGAPASCYDEFLTCHAKLPQWIASKAGNYSDRFISGFYTRTALGGRIKIQMHGLTVPKKFIRWIGYAYCSECWSCGSESFMKDLKTSLTCPSHNRAYLFYCPNCNAKFNKYNLIDNHCRCKAELVSPTRAYDDAASERFILNLFRNKDQEKLTFLTNTLNALNYNYAEPSSPIQKSILQASISITAEDQDGIEFYLLQLRKWYPALPIEALCAKLSTINNPTINLACRSFLDITSQKESFEDVITLETPPPFTLSTAQILRQLSIGTRAWKKLRDKLQPKYRKISHRHQHDQASIIEIFEIHAKIKQADKPSIDQASRTKLPAAAEILGISLNQLQNIIKKGHLTAKQYVMSPLSIDSLELQDFQNKTEHFDSLREKAQRSSTFLKKAIFTLDITPLANISTLSRALFWKSDCERVLHYLQTRGRYKSPVKCISRKNRGESFIINHREFITYAEAKSELNLPPDNIRSLIKSGLINAHPVTINGHIVFSRDELVEFKSNHISPSACAKLLDVKLNLASTILENCGIHPIVGAPADHVNSKLYSLREVESLLNNESSQYIDGISISQASAILNLPQSVTHQLILSNIIAANCDKNFSKLLASSEKAKNFWIEHVTSDKVAAYFGITSTAVRKFLAQLNTSPIYPPPHAHGMPIYRLSDFIDSKEHTCTTSGTLLAKQGANKYSLIKDICDYWKISQPSFTMNFIKSGYLHSISLNLRHVLDDVETQKINEFLEQYRTPSMIDRTIGHYCGFTHNLIRANIINKAENLPFELRNKVFIPVADIDRIKELIK